MRHEGWPTLLLYWVFWRLNRGPQGVADPQLLVTRVGDLDRVIERRRRAVLRRCTAAVDREGSRREQSWSHRSRGKRSLRQVPRVELPVLLVPGLRADSPSRRAQPPWSECA